MPSKDHIDPPRSRFSQWSRQARTPPAITEKVKTRMGISTRVMPAVFVWYPIDVEVGEPAASIRLDRHMVRYPEPFDINGLTHACRDFIVEAVKHQSIMDGYKRWVIWEDGTFTGSGSPSWHHGEQHG